jgi:protein with PEP-CTERM/exosortase system signal
MKSLKLLAVLLIGASALALSASPARAVDIISDYLHVFNAGGTLVGSATSIESEPADVLREVDTDLSDPAQIGNYILIYDGRGVLSDIVGVEDNAGHAEFAYVSDPLTLANWIGAGHRFDGKEINPGTYFETLANGGIFDISFFLNPNGGAKGGTASFFSDVPDTGSAVALLGIALAGIEGVRRMIRARKA